MPIPLIPTNEEEILWISSIYRKVSQPLHIISRHVNILPLWEILEEEELYSSQF